MEEGRYIFIQDANEDHEVYYAVDINRVKEVRLSDTYTNGVRTTPESVGDVMYLTSYSAVELANEVVGSERFSIGDEVLPDLYEEAYKNVILYFSEGVDYDIEADTCMAITTDVGGIKETTIIDYHGEPGIDYEPVDELMSEYLETVLQNKTLEVNRSDYKTYSSDSWAITQELSNTVFYEYMIEDTEMQGIFSSEYDPKEDLELDDEFEGTYNSHLLVCGYDPYDPDSVHDYMVYSNMEGTNMTYEEVESLMLCLGEDGCYYYREEFQDEFNSMFLGLP